MTAKECLKKYFGYDNFRKGQEEMVESILEKKDSLGIMPTGAGKSLCYQIPAILFSGITLVISPLISLMKDQVDALNENGIKATYINSSLKTEEYRSIMSEVERGVYKILYIAPERLEVEGFISLLDRLDVSMIAVDEAHCVSQWGHDFRPSYQKIASLISSFRKRPVITAFTATATQIVKEDMIKLLNLQNPYVIVTGFDRNNLYFKVEMPLSKENYIQDYVKIAKDNSGIIYCATRKNVDKLFEMLASSGYSATRYHAGLSDKERIQNQEDFIHDRKKIMIGTNAFGMGIDKSNIRYVIHYNMPSSIENYYQEAGRAGRDSENSECILLFSNSDIAINNFLIMQGKEEYADTVKQREKLNKMVEYCRMETCFRKYILQYFGEEVVYDACQNCSNCNEIKEEIEVTIESQKILSCIKKMNGRFGIGMAADVLKGSKNARILSFHLNELSTYGIMKEYTRGKIVELISLLSIKGYIEVVGEEYPTIMTTEQANEVLFKQKKVFVRQEIKPEQKLKKEAIDFDQGLLLTLKELRLEIAKDNHVPAYIVMSDATLKDMCVKLPKSKEEMLEVSGIGVSKQERYGEIFISKIKEYIDKTKPKMEKNKEEKRSGDTYKITYELYKQGKTVEEIAEQRDLTKTTIEGHLLTWYEKAQEKEEIDLASIVNMKYLDRIIEAIDIFGFSKLKILKENLPKEVTYTDIRYAVIVDKKRKNIEEKSNRY